MTSATHYCSAASLAGVPRVPGAVQAVTTVLAAWRRLALGSRQVRLEVSCDRGSSASRSEKDTSEKGRGCNRAGGAHHVQVAAAASAEADR